MSTSMFFNISKSCLKNKTFPNYISVRYARMRHRTFKFVIMNKYQPWAKPVNIKEIYGNFDETDPSQLRDNLRRNGLLPNGSFFDRTINLSCTAGVFDEFIPAEGDGKSSLLSVSRVKESKEAATNKIKNLSARREIRKYDSNFNKDYIVNLGESMYREALDLLPNYKKNESRLLELVTEKALADMLSGLECKTLVHSFNKHLEAPSLVSIRTQSGFTEGQTFAQVTIRFFSEQIVAIYDKFGRLIYGNAETPQDILEYVVLEKQVTEEFSSWRIHAKLIPNWLTKKLVYRRTERHESGDSDRNNESNKVSI